jgi:hypothetical protein
VAGGGDAAAAARHSFAQHWAAQVAGTSYVPWSRAELSDYLLGLLDRLVDLLSAGEYDADAVAQVGADLVRAHFTGSETLQQTVVVLGEGLPALFDGPRPANLDRRLVQALGALAAGYATALRDRALDEQDGIHRAMLMATRQAEKQLAVSEARFRTMFREAALGIAIGDLAATSPMRIRLCCRCSGTPPRSSPGAMSARWSIPTTRRASGNPTRS